MSDNLNDSAPELRQLLGSMILVSVRPLSVREIRKCLVDVAGEEGGKTKKYADIGDKEITQTIESIAQALKDADIGMEIGQVAGGYKIQTCGGSGEWLRYLLGAARKQRLSLPALETLSIIAYRQPVTRAEIEAVRGVNVDHVIRSLLELQLIRIVGRSELPGRPFTYGTSEAFLGHFGLKDLEELKSMHPSLAERIKEAEREEKAAAGRAQASDSAADENGGKEPDAADESAGDGGGDKPGDDLDDDLDDDDDDDDDYDDDYDDDDDDDPDESGIGGERGQ